MAVKTPFELPTEGGRYVVDGRSSKPRRVEDDEPAEAAPAIDPPKAPEAAITPPAPEPAPQLKD